jgi:hypothetical protein
LIFCGNIHCFIVHRHIRLQKITYCIAVTGNITSHYVVLDGGIHMMIKLDKPYPYYVTETGTRQGEIVAEDICQKQFQYPESIEVCKRYQPRLFNNSV